MISICPEFQPIAEFDMELIKVFKQDILLTLIATPPDIGEFLVGTRVFITGHARFTSTSSTINPDTFTVRGFTITGHMILLDALNLVVAANIDVRGNSIEVTFFGVLLNLIPISGRLPADRANTNLYGTFKACLFFKAIPRGTIIELDYLKVGVFIMSL